MDGTMERGNDLTSLSIASEGAAASVEDLVAHAAASMPSSTNSFGQSSATGLGPSATQNLPDEFTVPASAYVPMPDMPDEQAPVEKIKYSKSGQRLPTRRRDLDSAQRDAIVHALQEQFENRKLRYGAVKDVATRFNVNRATISRLWKLSQEQRALGRPATPLPTNRSNCGRKRKDYEQRMAAYNALNPAQRASLRQASQATGIPRATLHRLTRSKKPKKEEGHMETDVMSSAFSTEPIKMPMDMESDQSIHSQVDMSQKNKNTAPLNRRKDLKTVERASILSALGREAPDGKLRRGAVKDIAERYNVHRATVSRLWHLAMETRKDFFEGNGNGSSHFVMPTDVPSKRSNCGRKRKDFEERMKKLAELPLDKKTTLRSAASATGIPRTTLHRMVRSGEAFMTEAAKQHLGEMQAENRGYASDKQDEHPALEFTL